MRVNAFIRLTVIMAVSAAGALWMLAPPIEGSTLTVVMLAVLALTAELMGFLLPRGASGSISFIPYMTAVMLVPNVSALAAIVGVRAIVEIARRQGGVKFVFNTAQLLLSYSLAVIVYRLTGGVSLFSLRSLGVAGATLE